VAQATTELTYLSFPIAKWEKTDDGDLIVMGKATDGSLDSDDQVVDPAWSGKALAEWLETGGNVRVQHQALRDPAGKGLSLEIDRDGDTGHWVKSLVVEPVAKRLVEKGILTAYSVGIARPVIKRDPTGKARGGVVCGGTLAELSLVDRPANKACGLVLAKSEGGTAVLSGDLWGDEDLLKAAASPDFLGKAEQEDAEDPDLTKDGAPPPAQASGSDSGAGQASDEDDDGQDNDDEDQDQDGSDGGDAVSKASTGTQKAYQAERQAWLAAEPVMKGAVGATEYLQRRSAWVRWNADGEAAGLTGTRDGALLWLAKRGEDPATVLGQKRDFSRAQRDSAADSGAAMPDGSFPVHNGEDLGNAIHLAGHAKDPSAARAHIKRRAAALGMSGKIPDTWKVENAEPPAGTAALVKLHDDGVITAEAARVMLGGDAWDAAVKAANARAASGDDGDAPAPCTTCKGDGKIMDDKRTCPDCGGSGKLADMKGKAAEAGEVVKEGRDCPKCGASYHSDHKGNFCGSCGGKLPSSKADDSTRPSVEQVAEVVTKSLHAGLISRADADAIIAAAAKASRPLPAGAAPAKPHREPDGTSTVEQLEPDAGMPTDPDRTPDKVPSSVRGVGEAMTGKKPPAQGGPVRKGDPGYGVARMHDALCAAYSGPGVLGDYPALKTVTDALDEGWLAGQAAAAARAGKAKKTARLTALVAAAQELKAADPAVVEDSRAELHKSFSDMYPNLRISPKMGIRPGSYQRPYLSAGHAAEDPARNGGPNIPPRSKVPSPDQFRRPLISDGHEADSPANKADGGGDIRNGAPVRTGASRVFYSNAQREAARVAMQSIHDHIASSFPDMCPMAASKSVLPPDMGEKNVPHAAAPGYQQTSSGIDSVKATTTGPAVADGAEVQQMIADAIRRHAARTNPEFLGDVQPAVKAGNPGCGCCPDCRMTAPAAKAETGPEPDSPPAALTAGQVKALLTQHYDPLADRVAELQKQLDDIGARPDPAMAPLRGALAKQAPGGPGAPVERRSLVDEATTRANAARAAQADEEAMYRNYIESLTKSPDPATRERALSVLVKLGGGA
jgi:ribosomal protein S27AE